MPRLMRRDGFALPLTIFMVTLLTLMLAALFVRVQADRMVAESAGDMVDALGIAQGGLQSYLASTTVRPNDGDSTRVNVTGGYADVVAHVVQRPADTTANETFLVRSTGYVIEPTMGATPQASRTVAQFAEWQVGYMDLLAAFTSANHVGRVSAADTVDITGFDQSGYGRHLSGIRVPLGMDPGPGPTGIAGSPSAKVESGDSSLVAIATGVDWLSTITDGFLPDYDTFTPQWGTYPSYLVTGNLNVTADVMGSGLLIVTGDLTLDTYMFYWMGVIIVGGAINFESDYTLIYGAVVSGLNEQFSNADDGWIGENGSYTRIWNYSWAVDEAFRSLTGFVPITNGWVDNWATY